MKTSDFMLFLVFLTLMLMLVGCSAASRSGASLLYDAVGQIDTNGTNYKSTRKEPAYCQQTKGNITWFVPCSQLKHDEEL